MSVMYTAISEDGTPIAYWREGSGPPLLLVHGGACDHYAWYSVTPMLARTFTVYALDRRGRGQSGDTPPHTVARELEDIVAVLGAIGEPAHLLGHSAGAILALGAAERAETLRSLILYEPPFIIHGARPRPAPEILERMKALLAAGDHDEVLRIAMRESIDVPEEQIERMKAGPGWEHLRAVAPAIPYDWKLWDERLEPGRLARLRMPALLLLGSESPAWLHVGTKAVLAALPNARLAMLPGQAHAAMVTAPELFAQAVARFAAD
jgi:pimeloyl-ACP methyl ester carboxylesterase